jgi:hypothetical protein
MLADGRVLIVGRYTDARAEMFDPVTERFTATGTMVEVRIGHTATLLNDGRVLVVGGVANSPLRYVGSAEVYNPGTGSFSAVGSMSASRAYHTATLRPDGKVLISGGLETFTSAPVFRQNAEIFDPATNTFAPGPTLAFVYGNATATRLLDDRVLIVGGTSPNLPQVNCQLYDQALGTFSATGNLAVGRYAHTASLLPTGAVLIVGGYTGLVPPPVPAEIYE